MQPVFDDLYRKSLENEEFDHLMELITSRENILLAYRNIKTNTGSKTPGTDGTTIQDVAKLTPDEVVDKVRYILTGSKHGYRPKPVRRKEIPKPNGSTRPLGIPCMWDRLIQQAIRQILEPICEAKFSENSFGFRPSRSVEHAMARLYQLMQQGHLYYVVEFDIKGFFDNVDHAKLIRQLWALKIRDKHLLYIIKQILKAPIRMPNGSTIQPTKGTPQGGIISPLLANVVLNELDHWVESQWQENPVTQKYKPGVGKNNSVIKSHAYEAMRKTRLKEMQIVRYADDFRILCRTRKEAERVKIAVTKWLKERLKLDISEEKTKIVNVQQSYSDFLGFKVKVRPKANKYVVKSKMSDKAYKTATTKLTEQARNIARPRPHRKEAGEIYLFNTMVMGIQNYYRIATDISIDAGNINRKVMNVLTNRLRSPRGNRLVKTGRPLRQMEKERYGKSQQLRFVAGTDEPIYPIGYIKTKKPMSKRKKACNYTEEGRELLHHNLEINTVMLMQVMKQSIPRRSVEYMDNRISLFSAQKGKCAVLGVEFESSQEIHCHHVIPRHNGGTDSYSNLVLIRDDIHRLIHSKDPATIVTALKPLNLAPEQLAKINDYRTKAGNDPIQKNPQQRK